VGGGLAAFGTLALTGTQFLHNIAQGNGGGLAHLSNSGRLVNALFAGNSAAGAGAALYLSSPLGATILHATIAGATAGGGASAIAVMTGTVGITNSIIASYTVGISVTDGTARESHNLFFGNGNNFLGTVAVGGGSQTAAPRFVGPEVDDYHLRRGSPARGLGVDAGITRDIDGDVRPQGGAFDAGYDQFVNAPPVAAGDAYTVSAGIPLVVAAAPGVLANDTDANSDALTSLLASAPATGILNLSSNGGFTYTPAAGFTGVVTFSYRAFDSEAVSDQATVTLTVAAAKLYLPIVRRQ
jgi:hypothetical protein